MKFSCLKEQVGLELLIKEVEKYNPEFILLDITADIERIIKVINFKLTKGRWFDRKSILTDGTIKVVQVHPPIERGIVRFFEVMEVLIEDFTYILSFHECKYIMYSDDSMFDTRSIHLDCNVSVLDELLEKLEGKTVWPEDISKMWRIQRGEQFFEEKRKYQALSLLEKMDSLVQGFPEDWDR